VKSTIEEEEDRSKHLVIPGVAENDQERIGTKVVTLLSELGEKPRVSASRILIGRRRADTVGDHIRPVRVTFAAVQQVLTKARLLNVRNKLYIPMNKTIQIFNVNIDIDYLNIGE
jgi:hypothetical protein